jgi:hypothetical protein
MASRRIVTPDKRVLRFSSSEAASKYLSRTSKASNQPKKGQKDESASQAKRPEGTANSSE